MKTLLSVLCVLLALTSQPTYAGPNEGIIFNVHGNADGAATDGDPCRALALPFDCEDLTPTATPDANGVEWFVVVASSSGYADNGFHTVTFGIGDYDTGACYIAFFGPCHSELNPLEIPSDGWPGPDSGTSVSWAPDCLEDRLEPVYYFGVYAYSSQTIPLGPFYPGQDEMVVSCETPPDVDDIVSFGAMGCGGARGVAECPEGGPDQDETTWGRIKKRFN